MHESSLGLGNNFFAQMSLIRQTEQALLGLFAEGLIRGTVHTCIGQEATAVGVVAALDKGRDVVCSNHRGHGHYLAFNSDVKGLIAEILGKPNGICMGMGGSQHLHSKNFYTNGILGGMPPVACGMAFAEKLKKSGAVVTVFFGDGAMGEGNIYETLNLASVFEVPLLFAVEHNQYAQSTPTKLQHAGSLAKRAVSFGVPVTEVDGNDVFAVHNASLEIIHKMRKNPGPHMIFMHTYRLGPHSKGDDFRDTNEIELHRAECPIARLAAQLDSRWCLQTNTEIANNIASVIDSLKVSS